MKRRSFLKLMGLAALFPKTALMKLGEVKKRGLFYCGKRGFYIGDREKEGYIAYHKERLIIKGKINEPK